MRSIEGPFLLSVSSKVVFIIRVQSSSVYFHIVIMSYSATSSISPLNPKQRTNLNNLFSYIININISITVIINTSHYHQFNCHDIALHWIYLRLLENPKSIALERKFIIAHYKSFHRQTHANLIYVIRTNATYSHSSVTHPLIIFAIILIVYL